LESFNTHDSANLVGALHFMKRKGTMHRGFIILTFYKSHHKFLVCLPQDSPMNTLLFLKNIEQVAIDKDDDPCYLVDRKQLEFILKTIKIRIIGRRRFSYHPDTRLWFKNLYRRK